MSKLNTTGIVLILLVGLLTFHLPHFLIEPHTNVGHASDILELALLVNLVGAVAAAGGIYRDRRWGWLLGILIAAISVVLYVAQEAVGLPSLPQMWWEPSRIVSLLLAGLFVVVAGYQVRSYPSFVQACPPTTPKGRTSKRF